MCAGTEALAPPKAESAAATAPRTGRLVWTGVVVAGLALAALLSDGGALSRPAAFAALWWVAVVIVVRSDLDRFIIPDAASASMAGLGMLNGAAAALAAGAGAAEALTALAAALATGAAAFALFWLVALAFRRFSGREGLGFGDVKLAGACAIWLTPADAALALEIAALAGLAVLLWRRRCGEPNAALPFGAFLAPAAWLVFTAGPALRSLLDGLGGWDAGG